jgi:hypothetical protein
MSTKPTGLSAFTRKGARADQPAAPAKAGGPRKRAEGDTVALTVRVSKSDWMRLRQLADAEGETLQSLAITGLSKVLADHGLPPLETNE